jgi:ribosomal protein S18 acetylase RimI-like enzyme
MLSVINATFKDIDTIINLNLQIWPQTYSSILQPDQVGYMLGMMYSPGALKQQMESGHKFILCYSDDELVGFASFSHIETTLCRLNKLYVLPGRQGLGIGKFILNSIEATLQAQNISILELNVNIHNHNARAFYQKTGFILYKQEDIDIGSGYFMNDYVLRKAL